MSGMISAYWGNCPNATNCCNFNNPGCTTNNDYIDNGGKLNWNGACGPVTGGLATNGGQILSPPSATSSRQVLTWVDNVEGRKRLIKGECTLDGDLLSDAEGLFLAPRDDDYLAQLGQSS